MLLWVTMKVIKFKKSFPFSDIRSYLPPSLKILPFDINDQKGFL